METEASKVTLDQALRNSFGRAVRDARVRKGWTQATLAERLRELGPPLTQTMIAKIERGARPTPAEEIAMIAEALDVPVGTLFSQGSEAAAVVQLRAALQSARDAGDAVGHAVYDYLFKASILGRELEELETYARANPEHLNRRERGELERLIEEGKAQLNRTYTDAIDAFMESMNPEVSDEDADEAGDKYVSEHVDMMRGK